MNLFFAFFPLGILGGACCRSKELEKEEDAIVGVEEGESGGIGAEEEEGEGHQLRIIQVIFCSHTAKNKKNTGACLHCLEMEEQEM
jgi:hypothetical protein